MENEILRNLKISTGTAINAGSKIMKIYESDDFEVEMKGEDSPLTKADKASHGVIVAALSLTVIPVLSEEGKNIKMNDIARVKIHSTKPLFVDDYTVNRVTGSLVLVDQVTNEIVAAGMVR